METLIEIAKDEKIESKDAFRYGAPNRICYEVTTGRDISLDCISK